MRAIVNMTLPIFPLLMIFKNIKVCVVAKLKKDLFTDPPYGHTQYFRNKERDEIENVWNRIFLHQQQKNFIIGLRS